MIENNDEQEPVVRPMRLVFCAIFVLILLADQAKQIMLDLMTPLRKEILAIFNLVPVWNRGMSFGMLAQWGP